MAGIAARDDAVDGEAGATVYTVPDFAVGATPAVEAEPEPAVEVLEAVDTVEPGLEGGEGGVARSTWSTPSPTSPRSGARPQPDWLLDGGVHAAIDAAR